MLNKAKIYLVLASCFFSTGVLAQWKGNAKIYHKDWIDFNKNGKKNIYEDPTKSINERVSNLLSLMTVDEKTCQTATLYGYKRVLKDELPQEIWKNEIWKDGIANIDEHLNNIAGNSRFDSQYAYPFSKHANAINVVQEWFIEQTRLGIPVDLTNEGMHGLANSNATPLPSPIGIGNTWNRELVYKAGQ